MPAVVGGLWCLSQVLLNFPFKALELGADLDGIIWRVDYLLIPIIEAAKFIKKTLLNLF